MYRNDSTNYIESCTVENFQTSLNVEEEIVWIEPTTCLDYVREVYRPTRSRRDEPETLSTATKLIGYAVLSDPELKRWSQEVVFHRRLFILRPGDRDMDPDNTLPADDPYAPPRTPAEAVDPRTVTPGEAGVLTDRARGTCIDGAGSDDPKVGGEVADGRGES